MSKKSNDFPMGYIILGIFLLAIGICFIVFHNTFNILAIAMGLILAIFGIVFGILTIANKKRGARFAFSVIFSIICIVCGIVTAIMQSGAIEVIANIFCLLLIVDGSFKLHTSAMSKRYSVVCWWIILITSIPIIVSSFILTKIVFEDIGKMSVAIGIIITLDGIQNIISSFFYNSYTKRLVDNTSDKNSVEDEDERLENQHNVEVENQKSEESEEQGKEGSKSNEAKTSIFKKHKKAKQRKR